MRFLFKEQFRALYIFTSSSCVLLIVSALTKNFVSCPVKMLLAAGADVQAARDLGHTPLMRAAETGSLEIVEVI